MFTEVLSGVSSSATAHSAELPDTGAMSGFDDGLGAIYQAVTDLQEEGVASGDALVQENQTEETQEQAAEQAALQRAQSDQSSSGGGFLSSIGKACGDFIHDVSHLRIGQAFSDAGHDLSAGWNSPHFWSDLGKALTDLSIAAGVAGELAPLLGPLGAPVEAVSEATSAVAAGGQSLVGLRTGQFAADAANAQAGVTQARDDIALLTTREQDSLTTLSDQSQARQGSLAAVTQAIETNDATSVGAATFRIRG